MKIEYTYKIINVDKAAKSMEIVYESPKYGVLHVGARLPWENETVEQVVRMYNPALYWLEQERATKDVEENISGEQSVEVYDITEGTGEDTASAQPDTPEEVGGLHIVVEGVSL